jgi:hypothetical protein
MVPAEPPEHVATEPPTPHRRLKSHPHSQLQGFVLPWGWQNQNQIYSLEQYSTRKYWYASGTRIF